MRKPVQYEAEFIAHELGEWAKLVDERLKEDLAAKGIGISEALRRSLAYRVLSATTAHRGQYQLIFHEYGRFVDMGVGRKPKGVETDDAKKRARDKGGRFLASGRKPKKWYSRTFYGSLDNLYTRLLNNYQEFVVAYLKELENKQS